WFLPRVFLRDFRGETGDAADDENQLARLRREAHVVEHGGETAVDIDRQRLDAVTRSGFDGPDETDAGAVGGPSAGQREEHVDAAIHGAVDAVTETRHPLAASDCPVDEVRGGGIERNG